MRYVRTPSEATANSTVVRNVVADRTVLGYESLATDASTVAVIRSNQCLISGDCTFHHEDSLRVYCSAERCLRSAGNCATRNGRSEQINLALAFDTTAPGIPATFEVPIADGQRLKAEKTCTAVVEHSRS